MLDSALEILQNFLRTWGHFIAVLLFALLGYSEDEAEEHYEFLR